MVSLFMSWDYQVKLSTISYMFRMWDEDAEEANREASLGGIFFRPVLSEIIETHAQYLDLNSL